MFKTLMVSVAMLMMTSICHAETSSTICEENGANALTYTVCETTASPFGRLGKAFSKHIDEDGKPSYWIRLALGDEHFLYYN